MIQLVVLLLFLSFLIFLYIDKNILSPRVLVSVPWIIAFFGLSVSSFDFDNNSFIYIWIYLGITLFQTSYTIIKNIFKSAINRSPYMKLKMNVFLITLLTQIVLLIIVILQLRQFVNANFLSNFLFTLKINNDANIIVNNTLFKYFIVFSISFTVFTITKYKSFNRKSKVLVVLQFLVGLIFASLSLGRTALLMLIVSSVVAFIYTRRKYSIKLLMGSSLFFLLIFIVYQWLKFPYLFESSEAFTNMIDGILLYLSGGIVAFEKWLLLNNELTYGANLFRFFYEVFESVGFNTSVANLVQPKIYIGAGLSTNVYTIYQFYTSDFGIVFSVLVMSFLGAFHGYVFKTKDASSLHLYAFSFSVYPLIMQFFQDQYVSLTSTWIQVLFYGIVFYKTNTFQKE